jgi:hypothetical protein
MYLILSNSEVRLFYIVIVYLIGIQFLRMFKDAGIFYNSKPSILHHDK